MSETSHWASSTLEKLCSLIKDGTHGTHQDIIGGVPLLSAKDVRDGSLQIPDDCRRISELDYAYIHKNYEIEAYDILLTLVGTIGRCYLVNGNEPRFTIQRSVGVVRSSEIQSEYLYQYIRSEPFQSMLRNAINASAQGGVYLGALAKCLVEYPTDKYEQSKIAEILSTVDHAIEQKESLIAKQQRIKTGLMQDLLTRGIDEHENIRSEETHEFKDSPLGRIPVEWECSSLLYFVPTAEYGISSSLGEKGTPVLRMNNFFGGEAELSDLKYTDVPIPEKLMLKNGDVLFNRTNSWEHVGRTGIWRGQLENVTFASYLVRLNPNPKRLIHELLNMWLNWEPTQIAMRRLATPAVQQVNINPTNLRSLDAAFPKNMIEQNKIVDRVNCMVNEIRSMIEIVKKLRSLKTALMQDLLTGKARVTPLLEKESVCK